MAQNSALRTYLDKAEVSPAKVASALNIDRVTLWRWASTGVPLKRLSDMERVTGISAAVLRPDLAVQFSASNQRVSA